MLTVSPKNSDGKYRVVTEDGVVALNTRTNKALDGGGSDDRAKLERQAGYVNAAMAKKEEATS